jgi:hypothetical protein
VQDPVKNASYPANGAGADPSFGSFYIGNFCDPDGESEAGIIITKVACSTNWPDVYNFLQPGALPPSCGPAGTVPYCCSTMPILASNEVCVSDCSTGVPTILSNSWTFGDGSPPQTASNPACYYYASAGTYIVTQIECNATGCCTNSQQVVVPGPFQSWQNEYFSGGSLNSQAGANVDVYGTGMNNANKQLAGFAGNVPGAYLQIIKVQTNASNNGVSVYYLGAAGDTTYFGGPTTRTNLLDYTTGIVIGTTSGNYANSGWQDTFQTNILSGGNGLGIQTNMTDSGGNTNRPSRYYRVRVLLP